MANLQRGLQPMIIAELWQSSARDDWERALERYWDFVQPGNVELEQALESLDVERLRGLTPEGWYKFLHDEYFRWKYTAPNRYATTSAHLRRYVVEGELPVLAEVRDRLVNLDPTNIRRGLLTAMEIRGLGTAGASGLLSLMYPQHFATVDQFIVKALKEVHGLPEAGAINRMNPENLSVSDGVLLIDILARKASVLNEHHGSSTWTPRKIDKVLWTFGRG